MNSFFRVVISAVTGFGAGAFFAGSKTTTVFFGRSVRSADFLPFSRSSTVPEISYVGGGAGFAAGAAGGAGTVAGFGAGATGSADGERTSQATR